MNLNYPAGVTDRHIDALWADEDQERAAERADEWLAADAAWWRRYVKADDKQRRVNLIEARVEDVDLPEGFDYMLDLIDFAENSRWWMIQAARNRARLSVRRSS